MIEYTLETLNFLEFGCKYIERSQWDYFTKGLWVLFSPFWLFHMKEFLNEIFYNLLLQIHIVAPIDNMFWVNHCWIKMNFLKCVILLILHFIFESYQNMLTSLRFFLGIIKSNFVLYVMHITPHLHVVRDFWKSKNLKNTLNFSKI